MLTAMDMTMCPNLAVPAEVMQHVVQVESGANPFAIGVVGGRLVRQPASLEEARATVQMLDESGYDYSLGVAQVNRRNLGRYGLDTYEKAFDGCTNLAAGAQILAECYGRSGNDWGKAFSCYYSGDFVTGYRDGYVQKVYASMQAEPSARSAGVAAGIPLQPADIPRRDAVARVRQASGTPGYRVALRSLALDAATNAAVSAVADTDAVEKHQAVAPEPIAAGSPPVASDMAGRAPPASVAASGIFKPVVQGPNDPVTAPSRGTRSPVAAAPAQIDQANSHQEQRDAAFVF
jgi:type IV secretion system protein VirB1